jgi:hypothetical protein
MAPLVSILMEKQIVILDASYFKECCNQHYLENMVLNLLELYMVEFVGFLGFVKDRLELMEARVYWFKLNVGMELLEVTLFTFTNFNLQYWTVTDLFVLINSS